jgi:hypothetical protein
MHRSTAHRIGIVALAGPCLAAVVAAQTPAQRPRDPGAPAAQPPPGKGLIAGTLVTLDSGRPVRQGRVTLSGGDTRVAKSVVTDDQGRFSFEDLPSGGFTLSASRSGFLDVVYGQKRPGSGRPGTQITLTAGQRLDRVSLPITRGGVITGTVYDEAGDVVFGASVQAMRYVMRNGVRTLQSLRTVSTDDRGIYRVPVLPPGEYAVVATSRDGNLSIEGKVRLELAMAEASKAVYVEQMAGELRALGMRIGEPEAAPTAGYAPTFHPSALLATGSTSVTVDGPEERAGVDIRLPLVPLGSITGVVTADGALPPGIQITLYDAAETAVSFGTRSARVGPNGQFSFTGLPPGTYVVLARAAMPVAHTIAHEPAGSSGAQAFTFTASAGQYFVSAKDGPGQAGEALWAMSSVPLGGGTAPVTLSLQRGMNVSGSVVFDGPSTTPIDLSKLRLTVAPVNESGAGAGGQFAREGAVATDGQFTVRGVLPGRYRVVPSMGVPAGFLIESAMFGGRDVLDVPLDVKPGEDVAGGVVTFSTNQTELAGAMTDPTGKPAPDYTLILFPADSRFWTPQSRRIQTARPASDGRYAFRSMPAGDYRLIAVEDVEPGQWFDPAFLKELLGGSLAVSLAPGEKRVQDIRASR